MTLALLGLVGVLCLYLLLRRYVRIQLVEERPLMERKRDAWK